MKYDWDPPIRTLLLCKHHEAQKSESEGIKNDLPETRAAYLQTYFQIFQNAFFHGVHIDNNPLVIF